MQTRPFGRVTGSANPGAMANRGGQSWQANSLTSLRLIPLTPPQEQIHFEIALAGCGAGF
ncbi:hypothetical protein KL86DES1_10671 [uncultured Desulfovibrio sp.]|uniref:Uncharacterized protein n=1 Tax=uncultured Desulfovibrio sp. TaxID=167968 RepID=A0A212KZW2_9BACT|nr:hypothetical protein KL86DES1_10671 [uncultured Desulfovibrio sp.]